MNNDLRNKLRRLGVHKGAAKIQPRPKLQASGSLEALIDGREIDTPYGAAFVREQSYAGDHLHGEYALGDLLRRSPAIAAQMINEPAFEHIALDRVAFIDTETTGLAGGAGTLAFLVGVGVYRPDSTQTPNSKSNFHVHQFFLRNPNEEAAMLYALTELLETYDAVATFNGRSFDMPLLETRFTLARMHTPILRAPNLDLLMPSRRMWRNRLASCALSSLEQNILRVHRTQEDVPGYLIPEMYFEYVRSGDAREMPRVLYHNEIDILSMVSLATHLTRLFDRDAAATQAVSRDAGDWLALGKWLDRAGRVTDAEAALRACLALSGDDATRLLALQRLGALLKHEGRRAEAITVWQALSGSVTPEGVEACIELAKHYEWHDVNLQRALAWTREALTYVQRLSHEADAAFAVELAHRLERLEHKCAVH